MKNIKGSNTLLLVLLSVLFMSFNASAQKPRYRLPTIDSAHTKTCYLEMDGTIKRYVGAAEITEDILPAMEDATITIYEGSKEYLQLKTNKSGKCTFNLPLERYFKVQVSKEGYVTKFFEVKTEVPQNNLNAYSFSFRLDLFDEVKNLNVSVLKKPIAKVCFDPIYRRFQYDENYTARINFDIKKMYKHYYELQEAKLDSIRKNKNGSPIMVKKTIQ